MAGSYGIIIKTTNGGGFPVGISKQNKTLNNLSIYPNPAIDNITLHNANEGYLSIQNINGQEVLQQEITEPATNIDISTLPSGVYVVKLAGEKGVQVGKFVKQ